MVYQPEYVVQDKPVGIAHAFILRRQKAAARIEGATIFAYHVSDPSQYGIVRFDSNDKRIEIVEKPQEFLFYWAITGLYFYDNAVLDPTAGSLGACPGRPRYFRFTAVRYVVGLPASNLKPRNATAA